MYCNDYANAYLGGAMQPGVPKMPMMPTTPSLPWMPTMPATPAVPTMPNIPMGPGMPTTPYMPSTPMMPEMPTTPMMPIPPERPLEDTSPSPTMPMGPDFIIQPGPPVQEDINYNQGFLKTLIGRYVKVDFLIGTNMFIDREGTLVAVGISYIVLREPQTNRLVMCDIYSIKFVNILN
ncbi:hypothetical protein [Geosporobacter ferrireducens]|uniref:Uncharacterized protein n=1 Tax=Geosporobacter ferrireducens TaxID=1424294 RepID=A0A1D8GMM0_9FIRM|nr:hypothetical protein [Geosporobacter ferrireducens]AOT72159.1 hypothetical protein Gferi_23025 [Geosporobacter ferrireducens]MTI56048.1 alginate lyase [Geosporobacter ferrireducens]